MDATTSSALMVFNFPDTSIIQMEEDASKLPEPQSNRNFGFLPPSFQFFNPAKLIFESYSTQSQRSPLCQTEQDRVILRHRVRLLMRLNEFFVSTQRLPVGYDFFDEQGGVFTKTCPHRFQQMMVAKNLYEDPQEEWQDIIRKSPIGPFVLERVITLAEYHLWKLPVPNNENISEEIQAAMKRISIRDDKIREAAKLLTGSFEGLLSTFYHFTSRQKEPQQKCQAIWYCGQGCLEMMKQASDFIYELYFNPDSLHTPQAVVESYLPSELAAAVKASIAEKRKAETPSNTDEPSLRPRIKSSK